MGFFLIILIILLVAMWPAIKAMFAVNNIRKQYAEMDRKARQEARREQEQRKARTSRPRPPKVYSREEGEYVEFEEVDVTVETKTADGATTRETYTEQQVTDAEWEEIK